MINLHKAENDDIDALKQGF